MTIDDNTRQKITEAVADSTFAGCDTFEKIYLTLLGIYVRIGGACGPLGLIREPKLFKEIIREYDKTRA